MCAQNTLPPYTPSHGMGWVPSLWEIYDQEWPHDLGDPKKNKNTDPYSAGTKSFRVPVAEQVPNIVCALPRAGPCDTTQVTP